MSRSTMSLSMSQPQTQVAERGCRRWMPCFFSPSDESVSLRGSTGTRLNSFASCASTTFELGQPQNSSKEELVATMSRMLDALERQELSADEEEAANMMRKGLMRMMQVRMMQSLGQPIPALEVQKPTASKQFQKVVHAAMAQKEHGLAPALNELIKLLWPRIETFVQNLIHDSIAPSINDSLPGIAQGTVKFTKVCLGQSSPLLGPMYVEHNGENGNIEFHIGIDFSSDLDIALTAMRIPIGISKIFLKGDLVMLFSPPMFKPPFFGGVQVYFPNPPEVGISFGGAAKVADVPGLNGAIRGAIDSAVAGVCVLPRRIAVDMNDDDDVDIVDLQFPEPLGIMRVTLYSGSDLVAADTAIFGQATSDPYVTAKLGVKSWNSPTISKNLNPVWGENGKGLTVDFPVHDDSQLLFLKVFDYDLGSADDLIGTAKSIDVRSLVQNGEKQTVDLFHEDGSPGAGSLTISGCFLSLAQESPQSPLAVAGPSEAFLSTKLTTVRGLSDGAAYPFKVRIQVVDKAANPQVLAEAMSSASHIVQSQLAEGHKNIARNLAKEGNDAKSIANILEVTKDEVATFLRDVEHKERKRRPTAADLKEAQDIQQAQLDKLNINQPRFDEIVQMLLPANFQNASVELTLLDKKQKTIATAQVPMQDLTEADELELEGPFSTSNDDIEIVGTFKLRWLDTYKGGALMH